MGAADFEVVDEVNPAKPDFLPAPVLVGSRVDDGGHATDRLSVPACQEVGCLAEAEGGVAARVEGLERVFEQVGHGLRAVAVQLIVEADEGPHLLFRADLADGDCAHLCFGFPLGHIYRAKIHIFAESIDLRSLKNCKMQHFLIFGTTGVSAGLGTASSPTKQG